MRMKTVKEKILESKAFFEQLGIKSNFRLIVLFGSVAREKNRENSDIDIAVLPARSAQFSFEEEAELANTIAKHTRLSAIDLRTLHGVSPIFLHTVMDHAVPLYEDVPGRAQQYKLYAQKQMMETYHLRNTRWNHTLSTIAAYA